MSTFWLLVLLGCGAGRPAPADPNTPATTDSATVTTDSATTQVPPCPVWEQPERTPSRYRYADALFWPQKNTELSYSLDLADVDGDGCMEILTGEGNDDNLAAGYDYNDTALPYDDFQPVPPRAWFLEPPFQTGPLDQSGKLLFTLENVPYDWMSDQHTDNVHYSASQEAYLFASYRTGEFPQVLYIPQTVALPMGPTSATGTLSTTVPVRKSLVADRLAGGPTLVLEDHTYANFAGAVGLLPLPLVGDYTDGSAFRTVLYGAEGVGGGLYDVKADGDVNGDGSTDLMISMTYSGPDPRGGVVLLFDPPPGLHNFHEAADVLVEGASATEEFRAGLWAGDLDQDGYDDFGAGAPRTDLWTPPGKMVGFRGGLTPGHYTSDQGTWNFIGSSDVEDATGVAAAVGDFDGDGYADFAVGLPGNIYIASHRGSVALFHGPVAPGAYDVGAADVFITNGGNPITSDGFGAQIRTGRVDGDAYDDLVIKAGGDRIPDAGLGTVQVFFGSSDLFP